jgi:cellulose synthase/poly-beta-1,6-N-acetylglucosamine synthase-like glycosyltransferase
MTFLEIIACIAITAFTIRGIIFLTGAYIERRHSIKTPAAIKPFVSVVVPARNEEHNIAQCIKSINDNHYPKDKFEIIAVNDRSTDATLQILTELSHSVSNLKIINITEENKIKNLRGKPGALEKAIAIANGGIIMMTDADCLVGEHWIETVVAQYNNEDVGLVASFTNVLGKKIFDKIQAIEWAYLHTMASAGVGLKQPLGCYGNNLSVSKKAYNDVGGYKKIKFSVTEDLALLQAIHKKGYTVRYLTHKDADVDTFACDTFADYLKQRHRWAVGGLDLGWRAAIFVITSALLILGIISSLIIWNPVFFAAIVLTRMFWDYLLIAGSFNILDKKDLKKWIPLAVLFFIVLEIIVPFLLLKKKVVWKGQTFTKH